MADEKTKFCGSDIETHCDNPISLDEIENGLWLGEFLMSLGQSRPIFSFYYNFFFTFQEVLQLQLISKQ